MNEKHRISGGGVLVVLAEPGDVFTFTNSEGSQSLEVVAILLPGGSPGLSSLGLSASGSASALQKVPAVLEAVKSRGGLLDDACHLYGSEAVAGEMICFTATASVLIAIASIGNDMDPESHATLTPVLLEIGRSPRAGGLAVSSSLPAPLAPVVAEYRVSASTAFAYTVKAGQYIQIIDVDGKQCSDFLCFSSKDLAEGKERGVDVTATRSLVGTGFPKPGIYSKFFDQDLRPLVEVVQDTVGRHDSFGLACTQRYYDDAGYPGHANCTDNFNKVLAPLGVVPRGGWAAINFFFNQMLSPDSSQKLYIDEPWSRPGDYVLLRASCDLLCASSACPDDIDPANAWNPTDIHVRVYGDENSFPKLQANRVTADAAPNYTLQSGFHSRTSALTRRFSEYRGFWLPTSYTQHGALAEYQACRTGAVIIDLSALRKWEITGPDAETLCQLAFPRDVKKLMAVGHVLYMPMCFPTGGMIDDGTLFRFCHNNFRWVGGDDYGGIWLRKLAADKGLKVWVRESTHQLHNVSVQGPLSRDILKEIVWTGACQPTVAELQWFRFTNGRIGGYEGIPVVVSRTGYTGELGFEVWCHPKNCAAVWDAIWAAGQPKGLVPMGLDALDMVRIEAGLIFAGYEFCDQTDPFEAGVGFAVAAKKADDHVGKEALAQRRAHPQRVLVGIQLEGNELAIHGDPIYIDRMRVGVVTSCVRSPTLGKVVALARVVVDHSAIGSAVEVGKLDGLQKRIKAVVVRFPFYDPEKTKPRS